MMKKINRKKRTAQSIPISKGYTIISPFAFGGREWASNPCIPILNKVKIRLDIIIKKTFECVSLIV